MHNNMGEQEARRRARMRVVSYGPRSAQGAQVWNAMETLIGTAKKLGVNIFHYLRDRVSGARAMPSLAELIEEKLKRSTSGPRGRNKPVPGLLRSYGLSLSLLQPHSHADNRLACCAPQPGSP